MKIKADWDQHLHTFRRREFDGIFGRCPDRLFPSALELGAGDGFQSRLLTRYASRVVAADYSLPGQAEPVPGVEWRVCDAEHVDRVFSGEHFDLLFSSNMLEHLPEPGAALERMRSVLADDGVAVHVMPNVVWKLGHLALHLPNKAVRFVEIMTEEGGWRNVVNRAGASPPAAEHGNNPKTVRPPRSALARLLSPEPHGVSSGHLEELRAFSEQRWHREIERAGWEVAVVRKGPLASGYGFGLDRLRTALEWLGLSSEHVFISVKRGCRSPYLRHLA